MKAPVHQDIDLWEVWIEFNEFAPSGFGTLYVIGEVMMDAETGKPRLVKTSDPSSATLTLHFPPPVTNRARPKEVLFAETVSSVRPYERIEIFCGETLVAFFETIEVMI